MMTRIASHLLSLVLIASLARAYIPAVVDLTERDTITPPVFFSEVFGPIDASNDAPGFMASASLTTYDVNACAQMCNTLAFDAESGPCIYFNIYQVNLHNTPVAISCDMYNTVTDASTATTTGGGSLLISVSRGFSRTSFIEDGSFENGDLGDNGQGIFWAHIVVHPWDFVTVEAGGRSGNAGALFVYNPPDISGITKFGCDFQYQGAINTVAGTTYIISFFHTMDPTAPTNLTAPLFSVFWGSVNVLDIFQNSTFNSSQYLNVQVEVLGTGQNDLMFKNGVSLAHSLVLDDVAVFEKWL